MSRERIPESKKGLVGRVAEILRAYLYHEDESYAVIDMYFEKKNGESQHKRLRFGGPSDRTPEEYRDYPKGFFDVESEDGSLDVCSMAETVFPVTTVSWVYADGRPWDGKTLSQIRAENAKKQEGQA